MADKKKILAAIRKAQESLNRKPWVVETLDEVAEFFGRQRDTIKDWRKKGMPGKAGEWDLQAIVPWQQENVGSSGRGDTDDKSRAEAERRKAWAEAAKRELDLKVATGEFASVDEMIRLIRRADTHAISLWQQTPDRLLGLLPAKTSGRDKRRFRKEAEKIVADVIESQRQGLIDLREEYERSDEGNPSEDRRPDASAAPTAA